MFHAIEVKMAKTDAASRPSSEPGNRLMNAVTVTARNPSTGTDCRMSSTGISTFSARRSLAAAVAYTKVKMREMNSATNIRSSDLTA